MLQRPFTKCIGYSIFTLYSLDRLSTENLNLLNIISGTMLYNFIFIWGSSMDTHQLTHPLTDQLFF